MNVAEEAPKLTELAPVKPVPVSVTLAPGGPLLGAKLKTVGGSGGAPVVSVSIAIP